jgi:hypothetical protein
VDELKGTQAEAHNRTTKYRANARMPMTDGARPHLRDIAQLRERPHILLQRLQVGVELPLVDCQLLFENQLIPFQGNPRIGQLLLYSNFRWQQGPVLPCDQDFSLHC